MKRLATIAVVCFLAGCSNAPIAGFLDAVCPSKPPPRQPDRFRDPGPIPGPGDRIPPPDLGAPVGPPPAN